MATEPPTTTTTTPPLTTEPPTNTTTTPPLELTYKNPMCSYDHWYDTYFDDIYDTNPKDRTPFINCCTTDKPCGIDEGGCNSDEDCFGGLTCGYENCAFRYKDSFGDIYDTDVTANCCKVYINRTTLLMYIQSLKEWCIPPQFLDLRFGLHSPKY